MFVLNIIIGRHTSGCLLPCVHQKVCSPAGVAKCFPHRVGTDAECIYRATVYTEGTGKSAHLGAATKMRLGSEHSFACLYMNTILADFGTFAAGYAI